jgi:hypothetical protein
MEVTWLVYNSSLYPQRALEFRCCAGGGNITLRKRGSITEERNKENEKAIKDGLL